MNDIIDEYYQKALDRSQKYVNEKIRVWEFEKKDNVITEDAEFEIIEPVQIPIHGQVPTGRP